MVQKQIRHVNVRFVELGSVGAVELAASAQAGRGTERRRPVDGILVHD